MQRERLFVGCRKDFVEDRFLDLLVEENGIVRRALAIGMCLIRVSGQDAFPAFYIPAPSIGHPRLVGVIGE